MVVADKSSDNNSEFVQNFSQACRLSHALSLPVRSVATIESTRVISISSKYGQITSMLHILSKLYPVGFSRRATRVTSLSCLLRKTLNWNSVGLLPTKTLPNNNGQGQRE